MWESTPTIQLSEENKFSRKKQDYEIEYNLICKKLLKLNLYKADIL